MTIQYWKKLLTKPQFRQEEGKVLVEGKNLVFDLLKHNLAQSLIVTEKWKDLTTSVPIQHISSQQYAGFSRLENPEGIAAIVLFPKTKPLDQAKRVLILDRLQDPGNVGTLIRTALAFGFDHVALITPSCDPWNEKAVRAGKGAHFSLSIGSYSFEDIVAWQRATNAVFYVADLQGSAPETISSSKIPLAIILGNEAEGPDHRFFPMSTKITIPMSSQIESLNVAQAGAILLYQCKTV